MTGHTSTDAYRIDEALALKPCDSLKGCATGILTLGERNKPNRPEGLGTDVECYRVDGSSCNGGQALACRYLGESKGA